MELSENEIKLLKHFDCEVFIVYPDLILDAYRSMAYKAFLKAECFTKQAIALRMGLEAINKGEPYRLTPEFEKLITI